MLFLSSLRRLLPRRTSSGRPQRRANRGARPRLEGLEERALPAVVTWTNALGGDWGTASNWSTGRLPGAGDDAVIDLGGVTVTHGGGNDTIHSLSSSPSARFVLSGGALTLLGNSTLNGDFTFGSAFFTQRGELNLNGAFTWTAGTLFGHGRTAANGGITLSGSGTKSLVQQTLQNAGYAAWAGGDLLLSSNATWNNLSTATLDVQSVVTLSGGTLNNAGTILTSNGGGRTGRVAATALNARLNNNGVLDVGVGALTLGGGGVSGGTFYVEAGGTLSFSGGTHTLTATSSLGAAGDVGFSGAAVTVAGSYYATGVTTVSGGTATFSSDSVLAQLTLSGGALTGAGGVTATDLVTWTGGTMSGGGYTYAAAGMSIGGGGGKALSGRTLYNAGTAVWQDAGGISMVNGAVWDNLSGATLDVRTDAGFAGDVFEPTATFNNAGTFLKSSGSGTANAKLFFNNSGLVDVASGALSLNGAGTDSGTFLVEGGATLKFLGGQGTQHDATFTHTATSSLTGAGDVVFGTTTDAGSLVTRNIVGGAYGVTGNTTVSAGLVDFSDDVSLSSLTFSGGTLGGSGTVTVTGALTWGGGTLQGGHLVSLGAMTVSGTATKVLDSATLDNAGTATWTGGNFDTVASTWNNLPGATFDVEGTGQFSSGAFYSNPTFNNAGTFTKSAGANTRFRVFFNNSGAVDVSAGTLEVAGGGTSSGAFTVGSGATLTFDGGAVTLTPSAGVSGAGNVIFATDPNNNLTFSDAGGYSVSGTTAVSAGAVTLDGGATLTNLTLSGGILGGAGDVVVGGTLTWTGGTMTGGGTTFANGSLTIGGAAGKILDGRALVNAGTATWSGTGTVLFFSSASFDNAGTGTFDLQTDSTFGGLGDVLTNAGTLKKSAGLGITTLNGDLTTTGILEVDSGTLTLGGEVENHGVVDVSRGTTLQVNGFFTHVEGTIDVGGTLTLTGAGKLLDLIGGTLNGTGVINASVINAAVVNPGGDGTAGVLTLNGNFSQTTTGVLSIDLGGTAAGTEYDQLHVNGAVSLDGTLQVQLIGGYNPVLNDAFQILTYTSRSGDFAAQSFPTLGGGLFFVENPGSNDLRLETH